ncbi:response regulator [Elusimicrobiota bacterium]
MMNQKKKVLIAEDNEDIMFVLEEGLEEFSIISASDGEEAYKKIKIELPDLIILDIMMPELNGADLNRRLKNEEKLKDIPVIIITGRANMKGLFSEQGENRVSAFIEKPFSLDILKKEINSILE